jgi:hypothetical protein
MGQLNEVERICRESGKYLLFTSTLNHSSTY